MADGDEIRIGEEDKSSW